MLANINLKKCVAMAEETASKVHSKHLTISLTIDMHKKRIDMNSIPIEKIQKDLGGHATFKGIEGNDNKIHLEMKLFPNSNVNVFSLTKNLLKTNLVEKQVLRDIVKQITDYFA